MTTELDLSKIDWTYLTRLLKERREANPRTNLKFNEPILNHPPHFFHEPTKIKPATETIPGKYEISIGHVGFQIQPYHLFHGTSTKALDNILKSGLLHSAAYLENRGELVWGEFKNKGSNAKYAHPEFLEQMGVELTDYHRQIYGHAFGVFFSANALRCLSFTPDDTRSKTVIGINRKALEYRGYEFRDCKEEGIQCESHSIDLTFGLQVLLVPDLQVEEYKQKIKGRYSAAVFPLSELDKI